MFVPITAKLAADDLIRDIVKKTDGVLITTDVVIDITADVINNI